MKTYVYCFTRPSHPLPLHGLEGVGAPAAPLRILREDELTAVVSDVHGDLRPKRRDLARHQAVLEALCAGGAVLPMRFGTVAPEDGAVRAELRAGAHRCGALLARIEGHAEINVKGFHREEALLVDLLRRDYGLHQGLQVLRARAGGSHRDKVAFGERVAAAVDECRSRDAERAVAWLRPHASEVRLGPPVEGCFVNASFLVAAGARSGFEAALEQLRGELGASAQVESYGPLPPYSFVGLDEATA